MPIKRFGVSLESEILDELDQLVANESFPNRSQAIRYLISNYEVSKKWNDNEIVTGAIVLVYDHKKKELHSKVKALQHAYNCLMLSAQHIHLDENNCIETITIKGKAERLTRLANRLKAIKGIKHGSLTMSAIDT